MFGLETGELLLILIIILLFFGAKKLPELSKSIGESIRELRRGMTDDVKKADDGKKAATTDKNTKA